MIIGVEYDSILMIGHNNQGVFRDQHQWGWPLRVGAGIQWAGTDCWIIGLDYVHTFPGNATRPGPLQGPDELDQNVCTVQARSDQAILTLSYHFGCCKRRRSACY